MSHNSKRFNQAQEAVLTTLAYADIFSFPLTHDELWQLLISREKITKTAFEEALRTLHSHIIYEQAYYCLPGGEKNIANRFKNLASVSKKMALAKDVIPQLSAIPTVVFIGISGSLAVGNVTPKDDIDLFVIVRKNTLYFSRLLILSLLQLLGRRRKRGTGSAPDTFCVNFLIDESQLAWREDQRDVYTAREIAQLLPMMERGMSYQSFLEKNRWIQDFLPNIFAEKRKPFLHKKAGRHFPVWRFLENFFRFIQISYMKKAHTTEVITNHYLAFHPYDYRVKTLERLRLKMQSLGLLTKL